MENQVDTSKLIRVIQINPKTGEVVQKDVQPTDPILKEGPDNPTSCPKWENEEAEADDDDAEEASEKSIWLDSAIKFLLSSVKELHVKIGKSQKFRTKKNMWQEIERRLKSRGYNFTQKQVENKYFSLERSYKRAKMHNNRNGMSRQLCTYEKEMHEILDNKWYVKPENIDNGSGEEIAPTEQVLIPESRLYLAAPSSTSNDCGNSRDIVRNADENYKISRILQNILDRQDEYNRQVLQLLCEMREDQKRSEVLFLEQNDLLRNLLEKF